MAKITDDVLIYDIETATDGKPDPEKDKLRVFGCYSYKTKKHYFLTKSDDIKKIIKAHKYLVGFNNLRYDNVVMYHCGFSDIIQKDQWGVATFQYKINIDMMEIFKKRASAMKIKKGMLGDLLMKYSLDFISKTIGIVNDEEGKIQDFDYTLLNKKTWTPEEKKLIGKYTLRDIQVTRKMYEWLEDYFDSFKDFLNEKDVETKKYLTASTAVFTYKAICKKLGWEEEYSNEKGEKYGGGYVAYPAGPEFKGNIYCMDYNSLYPHIFSQCNLYSESDFGWNGGKLFTVNGMYNDKVMGAIEKLIMELYNLRLQYKKDKDPREYAIKINLNTIYGLAGNPSFKHLYNRTTADDCTSLARQWVMLARKYFKEDGYEVIYTDTDSVYFIDKFNDEERMLKTRDRIIKDIKDNVPFPQETFDMGVDYKIQAMWFFKGKGAEKDDLYMDDMDAINKPKGYMKKNYIFLTEDGNVVVKNLGVRKKSISQLSRKIFWEYLVPKIKEEKRVKFPKSFFRKLIYKLLEEDISLAQIRYSVNDADSYKLDTQMQAQVAKRYGTGIHFLIPNKLKIGAGTKKFYCTLEEFKKKNMKLEHIDLSNVWKELEYFIQPQVMKNIFSDY